MPNGFMQAEAITKEHAKTFYFASRFLNKKERCAAYAVYAFCRISDDAVDVSKQNLNPDLTAVFQETVNKYQISHELFAKLKSGINMDLNKTRYQNFTELYDYCYKVAGVVGLIMLKIFGCYDQARTEKSAVDLGVAMQLTNILRDIKEDLGRGRIYLPQDEMQKYNINETSLRQQIIDANFKDFMQFQIQRARQYYENSRPGIKLVSGLKNRFVILAMKEIYSGILDAIKKNNYDVYNKRAHVNIFGKIKIILKILFQGSYL